MNCVMVKVSGRVEPEPAPAEGAGVDGCSSAMGDGEGAAGVEDAAGAEEAAGAAVLEGEGVATGVAVLEGVAGVVPELAPSHTLGPGMG
jgi:hypothetical protein